jgi:phosphoserine phosphatase RsbU/P
MQYGQQLLSDRDAAVILNTLTALDEGVLSKLARWLDAAGELWITRELLPTFHDQLDSGTGLFWQSGSSEPAETWMRRTLRTGETLTFSPVGPGDWQADESHPTAIVIPLPGKGDAILGVLQVSRAGDRPFSLEEREFLAGFSTQIALALQSAQGLAIEQWRIEQLSLVRDVSMQIAGVRDLDELSRQLVSLILKTFKYYFVAIFTQEPGQQELRFRASAGPERHSIKASGYPSGETAEKPDPGTPPAYPGKLLVKLGEGMIGYTAQSGQEMVVNDIRKEPQYRFHEFLPDTLSEVTLPLTIEGRILGVLDVQSDQLDDFHETDLLVLRALASNIAVAAEGARLYSGVRRRAEQLSAIYEVSNAITSVLDPDRLLTEVVSLIHRRFHYPFVNIFTVHPGRRKVIYEAGSGARSQALDEAGYVLELDDPQGIIPWVARNGETMLVNDVEQEPLYRPSPLPPHETLSELCVPVLYRDEVLGVLDVQSDHRAAFGEEDRFLFESLADNVATAMHNASLFRSEVWRRQVSDSLHAVAGLLSADVNLDHVLEVILKELVRNLPCDLASIWLLDEKEDRGAGQPGADSLRLAALQGPMASILDLAQGLSLQSFIQCSDDDPTPIDPDINAALVLDALTSQYPVIRIAPSPSDPLAAALGFPPDYSAIAAPLRIGEQNLGVLVLLHRTPGRYGVEASSIAATFSSYAAVAIENTRLYEDAHEQAWVSTVLLQVAEAAQTITNARDLMNAIAQTTPMLVGVSACAIFSLDEDDTFISAAAAGLSVQGQEKFNSGQFPPGDIPMLDELLEERHPSIARLDGEKSPLVEIFAPSAEAGERPASAIKTSWIVGVPLMGREELLGAFLVVYNLDPSSSSLETEFEETVSIIQGVAQQLALALENLRLAKSQRDEAYVSVALLQVAQAVVSTNDLDDILGSIVRITPILVGVRRVAIFLRGEDRAEFFLGQGYGLPKTVENLSFKPGSFPLLDMVYQEDSLLVCPLQSGREPILAGEYLEHWTSLPLPEPETLEVNLDSADSLLLAFPLSVKGQVLGVFLVEEPTTAVSGGTQPGGSNRRMRSKRLEITTGITQQAALAIQNDRLQREALTRERLEREMQLARDIQRTFLPHQIPELPGWELNTYWQPAREVAGDFYDFFQMESNRLGLLIADVADKGMPAALFMTLVRTLIHAVVQQVDDPADVLARVNELLAPDAEQGMFVTLFYAVMNLESGELAYANAGHNPPMIYCRHTGEVVRFEKGELALGVLPESRYSGHYRSFQPGDCLVLYTDGITEAFSPSDQMFGEQGLQETIRLIMQRSPEVTADELLRGIDESVQVFVGDAPLADDLTLVVLRRDI